MELLKTILEQYRNGERGMPTYDELAAIVGGDHDGHAQINGGACRAQADARPVGHFFKASRVHPWVQVEKECPNAVPLYTHPEASAPQTLQPPERGVCATTVPIPPDCNLAKK